MAILFPDNIFHLSSLPRSETISSEAEVLITNLISTVMYCVKAYYEYSRIYSHFKANFSYSNYLIIKGCFLNTQTD